MSTQIVSTPGVLGGKPHIDGTRISVGLILGLLSLEWTIENVLEEFDLTREQILAALSYREALVVEGQDSDIAQQVQLVMSRPQKKSKLFQMAGAIKEPFASDDD
jgi:uncharacterized protein (DUF433 family)